MQTPTRASNTQRGVISGVAIGLLIVAVAGVISLAAWAVMINQKPKVVYKPIAVTADDNINDDRSTKQLVQDVKILEAGMKRADAYEKAANGAVNDEPQSLSGTGGSGAEQEDNLSEAQTTILKEGQRRIDALNKAKEQLQKLDGTQRPGIDLAVTNELAAITDIRNRVSKLTDMNTVDLERQTLTDEYKSYLLAISQVHLLVLANDQSQLIDKFNKVGGKIQERADEASSNGKSTAALQVYLNDSQANKTTAKALITDAIKDVSASKLGEPSGSRSVLKTQLADLGTAQNELTKAMTSVKKLALAIQQLDEQ